MRGLPLFALLVFAAGCPPTKAPVVEPLDGGASRECAARADCPGGKICTPEGACSLCSSSGQCRLREDCQTGTRVCALKSGWGEACSLNTQCPAGRFCRQGLCEEREAVQLCPTAAPGECAAGFRCNTANSVCEQDLGCVEDGDCAAAEVCNVSLARCVPRCTAETEAAVCPLGQKCYGALCGECGGTIDCPAGSRCNEGKRCVTTARCFAERDCAVPLICHLPTGACLERPPPCVSDESCPLDERCDVSVGRCVPRACQPDRLEPNGTRAAAFGAVAQEYSGLTLCELDQDFFLLQLSRGDQLGLNIDADPFAESAFLSAILDSQGRVLATGKFTVSYVAPVVGSYYVRISTSDPTHVYDVTFLLSRGVPCDDDGNEPNDTSATAVPLQSSRLVDGRICPQDVDHFRFDISPEGGTVTLSGFDVAQGALSLCLFELVAAADGGSPNPVARGCSDDAAPAIPIASAGSTRTYLAQVKGQSDRAQNGYTLQVTP